MRPFRQSPASGAVVLVALCFTAVLGIAIGTYLALCSRVMSLSDRTFHSANSGALAQLGVEQALYAINNNTWTSWTNTSGGALAATDTVALRTMTVGSHSVYIRFNNRNATNWSPGLAYTTADIVWYLGKWYQCTAAHSAATDWQAATNYNIGEVVISNGVAYECIAVHANQLPPNTSFWTPILSDNGGNWASAPSRWNSLVSYSSGDIVIQSGVVYRCTGTTHTNQQPPNTTYWTSVTANTWSSATSYSVDDVAWHGGTLYRCIVAHSNQTPPNTAYWASAPVIYAEGAAGLSGTNTANIETQLRAAIEPAPLFPNALGATQSSSSAVSAASATSTIDSYNSLTGSYSSVGSAENYSAVVAGPSVTMSGATTIRGFVAATTSTLATTTNVKSASSPSSPNADPTRITTSYYVPAFSVNTISDGGNLPNGTTRLDDGANTLGTVGANAPSVYNIVSTSQYGSNYSGLYLPDTADILTIQGPVVLNVTGSLQLDYGRIRVLSTGSLIIRFTSTLYIGNYDYMGYGTTGGLINEAPSTTNPDPRKMILIGTSTYNSSSNHYFWQTQPFYGLIYMPNAYLHAWNSGYAAQRYGAFAARNVYFNHTANFHYDSSLRITGGLGTYVNASGTRISVIDAPFQVSRLRELTDPAERITMP
jgi:hypothetical protein